MNEIMEKTYELIDVLDSSEVVKKMVEYKEKILGDRELCELINRGNLCDDDYLKMDIKKKLYDNSDYRGYMECYNELFYIVMRINKRFLRLINNRSCCRNEGN